MNATAARLSLPVVWASMLTAIAGCTPSVQGKDACRADGDCLGGRVCQAARCIAVSLGDAAGSVGDGGGLSSELYDDFEMPVLRKPLWEPVEELTTVTIDNQRPHRGSQSLRVHFDSIPAGGDVVQGELTEIQFVPPQDFFARFFIYVPNGLTQTSANRFAALIQETLPRPDGFGLWLNGSRLELDTPGQDLVSTTAFPLAAWVCVEWQVRTASVTTSRVWLDGTEVSDLSATDDTQLDPPVQRFVVGFAYFGNHVALNAGDVWIDDVAVSSQRVGCD